MEMKEVFNQIKRYQRHSFNANHGLLFTQPLVISNGVNTKYYSTTAATPSRTTYWANQTTSKSQTSRPLRRHS